jgi:hypothetical protein
MTGVDPAYRHTAKLATPDGEVALGDARVKFYRLAPADKAVPDAIADDARTFLPGALDLGDERGFAILHRCGESFYFLLVSLWRGSNELWEAVFYREEGMTGFATFDPAYPAGGPRPTFCVWELGVVAAESAAWASFLASARGAADDRAWLADRFSGTV